jgi:hypothetical protein
LGGGYSQEVLGLFLISIGVLGASVSCKILVPKSVSTTKMGWLVGFLSSLIM